MEWNRKFNFTDENCFHQVQLNWNDSASVFESSSEFFVAFLLHSGNFHTTPEKFQNADLFPSLSTLSPTVPGPTVHINPSRKRSFSKTLFKLKNFRKRWRHNNEISQMIGDCFVLKSVVWQPL